MANYYIALSEINIVLELMGEKYTQKIPSDLLDLIKKNKNDNLDFKYNLAKSLWEQNMHEETFELLSYINYNFWASNNEKEKIRKIYNENILKDEQKKLQLYNPTNIFKNNSISTNQNCSLTTIHKENILSKFLNKIKAILKINHEL